MKRYHHYWIDWVINEDNEKNWEIYTGYDHLTLKRVARVRTLEIAYKWCDNSIWNFTHELIGTENNRYKVA